MQLKHLGKATPVINIFTCCDKDTDKPGRDSFKTHRIDT